MIKGNCWSSFCHGQWWGYSTCWIEYGCTSCSKACSPFCGTCWNSQGRYQHLTSAQLAKPSLLNCLQLHILILIQCCLIRGTPLCILNRVQQPQTGYIRCPKGQPQLPLIFDLHRQTKRNIFLFVSSYITNIKDSTIIYTFISVHVTRSTYQSILRIRSLFVPVPVPRTKEHCQCQQND